MFIMALFVAIFSSLSSSLVAAATVACTPAKGAGLHSIELTVDGLSRKFLLSVPSGVDVSAGLPGLVSIHGYSSNPYYYSLLAGTERFNNDQPFNENDPDAVGSFEYDQAGYKWLVALPFGTAKNYSPNCCSSDLTDAECASGRYLDKSNPCEFNAGSCCGTAPSRKVDDVAFMKAIAGFLVDSMCANSDALFASGFSNGGMMTNRVGCELSSTFKGIAPFDGTIRLGGDFSACAPESAISVVQFCGTSDSVCSGDIASTMHTWAARNGCGNSTVATYTSATTKCSAFQGCPAGIFVEQCLIIGLTHNYAGHLRPGGAPDFGYQPATNIDGYRYIMNRFSTLLPAAAARAAGLPTMEEQEAALADILGGGALV